MASGWVQAFSAGEPAMREFLELHMAEGSFTRKPMAERMATYRESRERFGTLALGSVVRSSRGALTVRLIASDVSMHDFTFAVETRPPHRLISVSRLENRRAGHGGFGFHH